MCKVIFLFNNYFRCFKKKQFGLNQTILPRSVFEIEKNTDTYVLYLRAITLKGTKSIRLINKGSLRNTKMFVVTFYFTLCCVTHEFTNKNCLFFFSTFFLLLFLNRVRPTGGVFEKVRCIFKPFSR